MGGEVGTKHLVERTKLRRGKIAAGLQKRKGRESALHLSLQWRMCYLCW